MALDSSIEDWSRRLITAIGFTGIAMVEFKKSDHATTLMEINGRPWGSLQLPISAVLTTAVLDRLVVKEYGASKERA